MSQVLPLELLLDICRYVLKDSANKITALCKFRIVSRDFYDAAELHPMSAIMQSLRRRDNDIDRLFEYTACLRYMVVLGSCKLMKNYLNDMKKYIVDQLCALGADESLIEIIKIDRTSGFAITFYINDIQVCVRYSIGDLSHIYCIVPDKDTFEMLFLSNKVVMKAISREFPLNYMFDDFYEAISNIITKYKQYRTNVAAVLLTKA
jgi:hypothetical protein